MSQDASRNLMRANIKKPGSQCRAFVAQALAAPRVVGEPIAMVANAVPVTVAVLRIGDAVAVEVPIGAEPAAAAALVVVGVVVAPHRL